MLHALYNVVDRSRRPLRNHHFMVFRKAKVAYARILGTPLQSIYPFLQLLSRQNPGASQQELTPRDSLRLWDGDIELLTARELKRRHPEFPVFALVQTPEARIASCYERLIQGDLPLPAFFTENRFYKDMPINAFLDRIGGIPDLMADNRIRSQASILCYKQQLVPDLTIDVDRIGEGWHKLRALVKKQSGLDFGAVPVKAGFPSTSTVSAVRKSAAFGEIIKKYRRDYSLFYPGSGRDSVSSTPSGQLHMPSGVAGPAG